MGRDSCVHLQALECDDNAQDNIYYEITIDLF